MQVRDAIRLWFPLRDAIKAREAVNYGDAWPGCDAVQSLDVTVEEERRKCVYLISRLQDAHAARILARASGMPGYMYLR